MRSTVPVVLAFSLWCACPSPRETTAGRASLRKVGGDTVEVLPSKGQLPFCLVFTHSMRGVIRQLTMNRENRSVRCEADHPVDGVTFRLPVEEGKVKFYVVFSDQKLNAGSVAQQVYENSTHPKGFSAFDLRVPGQVNSEILEFTPEAESAPQLGGRVVANGEVEPGQPGADAGP